MLLLNASDGGNCGAGNTPFAPCFEHLSKRLTVVTSFLFKQAAKLYTDKSLTKQALDEWKMSVLSQHSTESLLRTKYARRYNGQAFTHAHGTTFLETRQERRCRQSTNAEDARQLCTTHDNGSPR